MKALGKTPGRLVAVKSPGREMTGEYGSVIIELFMRLTIAQW
jgi:hypothetical protein